VVHNDQTPDAVLLLAARQGDSDAFDCFYRRYNRLVTAYCRRRTGDAEQAADLMAETFAAVLIRLTGREPLPTVPGAWLFRVASNKCADSSRRGAVEDRARRALQMVPVVLDREEMTLIDGLASAERVIELLGELPDEQQEAVRARIIDEREYEGLARELGCSEPVVRKRVSRGLAALRARLESDS
jgi:RNA polymerase sigma factor (sigma-70 family)